MTMMQNKCYYY